jgi:hypothetical protein
MSGQAMRITSSLRANGSGPKWPARWQAPRSNPEARQKSWIASSLALLAMTHRDCMASPHELAEAKYHEATRRLHSRKSTKRHPLCRRHIQSASKDLGTSNWRGSRLHSAIWLQNARVVRIAFYNTERHRSGKTIESGVESEEARIDRSGKRRLARFIFRADLSRHRVIASEAKQSSNRTQTLDFLRRPSGAPRNHGALSRHCERSEAIQESLSRRLDCFVAPLGLLAMTIHIRLKANS